MTTASGRASLVEGEFVFTAEDFRHIAQTLHAHAGIALSEGKAALVYSRLAKRLRLLGLRSFRDYCALIEGVEGVDERQAMTAALTTNVTRFYREPHHFDHLRDQVMPELAARARAGGRVRLWSAACSNGQEPYSMALTVLDVLPEAADLDVRILATDIDPNMVAEGAAGVYSDELLSPVPAAGRKHFTPVAGRPGLFSADETLRRLVSFRELNLIGDWPMRGKFDVIFCRNVVIYFDDATQEMVWGRFTPIMAPGATLYIGHSERVSGPATAQLQTCGLTAYRLGGRA
ncbi:MULTISPECIES: protein-glutamate O-methyltransferase CheR [unclassified Brevundimonas]|uniref:CheR family methyltransferase n=1 Tax=unclassified Brevundimonas TaxID=2622653 RepID=UPI000CFD5467|nr:MULTISPECIES: protein-glutamate O-methyltransferase [unclassified Brevundimonas]PRA27760.1 chemotaxis protein [Brevundimonas sp. MYb27]PQZ81079.1 chemotaxis protein [Brevundimonas sp. MYb31]PRB15354.1 chemotaxis protein [Brevundimonas sp. MYb52]PRB35723.1 chemotaxis protein [Brevundimonas sp. MYb46]PRB42778.1 chemotaxis protein [Brevundimonas sp. MYb33]